MPPWLPFGHLFRQLSVPLKITFVVASLVISGVIGRVLDHVIGQAVESYLLSTFGIEEPALAATLIDYGGPLVVVFIAASVILQIGKLHGASTATEHPTNPAEPSTTQQPRPRRNAARWRARVSASTLFVLIGGVVFLSAIIWNLIEQRSTNIQVQRALTRYVLPRHLTDAQKKVIADYLKGFPPHIARILVPPRDYETNNYASEISEALKKGGWTITSLDSCVGPLERQTWPADRMTDPNEWCENIPPGITTYIRQGQPPSKPDDQGAARQIFMDALKKARVATNGGGGGAMPPPEVTTNSFVIRINARRMDDALLKWNEIQKEQAKQKLEEDNDDLY